jgi:protocatechuate 3,4-dioxygenase beta subunit
VLAAVLAGLIALILAALFLAPERPEAPERSVMEYTARPDTEATPASFPESDTTPDGDTPRRAKIAPPDEKNLPIVLAGVVRSSKDGQPVARAAVRVMYTPEALQQKAKEIEALEQEGRPEEAEILRTQVDRLLLERQTQTDKAGHYAIGLPEAGPYYAEVTAWGFIPQQTDVFEIPEGEDEVRQDFTLSRGASVAGRILERGANAPAPNVSVSMRAIEVEGRFSALTLSSDGDGNYMFEGLVPGKYVVSLNLQNAPYLVAGEAPAREVQVPDTDAALQGIDFVLEPAGTVWGYVKRATDQSPVRGGVMISSQESPITQALQAVTKATAPLMADTNDEGYYELIGVPLKKELCVYFLRGEAAPQLSDPFILTPTHRSIRVDLNVFGGTRVFGTVVDQAGTPISAAQVGCMPAYGALLRPMRNPLALGDDMTEDDGAFEFLYIPPGEYQIVAQHEGYKFELSGKKIYSTGSGQIGPLRIVLSNVESGRYSVYGYVTDADGRPIEEVDLHLAGMSSGALSAEAREVKSDGRGYYVFYGVDTGYYILTAEKPGYRDVLVREVRLDQSTDIVMLQTVQVEGTLLARDTREAPEGAHVSARPQEGDVDSLRQMFDGSGTRSLEADGHFTIDVVTGTHLLRATAPNYLPLETAIEVGSRGIDVGTIYLDRASGKISGEVRTVDGSSPAGSLVRLSDAGTGFLESLDEGPFDRGQKIRVDADGRFAFENVPPGRYQVFARLSSFPEAHSAPIELGDGQEVRGLVVLLGLGGTFEGYVMQDGAVVPDAVVTVNGNGFNSMTTTDYNGFYRIESIPAGTYMAMAAQVEGVNLASFTPMHTTIEIAEGQTTVHNFGEEQGVVVAGRVAPPPQGGEMGYAVVTVPGAGDMIGGRLNSPADWFSSADGFGAYMIDVKPIDGSGQFRLTVPPGDYDLHIIYASVARIVAQDVRPLYTQPLEISSGEPVELSIRID